MIRFHSGLKELTKIESLPFISSTDSKLDDLLLEGFHQELLYLLYGDKSILTINNSAI